MPAMTFLDIFITTMSIVMFCTATRTNNSGHHHHDSSSCLFCLHHIHPCSSTDTTTSSSTRSIHGHNYPSSSFYKQCYSYTTTAGTTTSSDKNRSFGILTLRTSSKLGPIRGESEQSSSSFRHNDNSSNNDAHHQYQPLAARMKNSRTNQSRKNAVAALAPAPAPAPAKKEHSSFSNRRDAIWKVFSTCSSTTILAQPFICKPSHAACLSGDTSPDCIGVYKVPLDDAISSYIDTPEHLAKYAPDLKWVPMTEYPKSYKDAKDELLILQTRLQSLILLVKKGELTLAGVELLEITPRVTVAGRVILGTLEKRGSGGAGGGGGGDLSMRAMRTENAHLELLASLGAADIVIGQALNGRLGSITMAQIQILDDLNNACREFEELIKALPPPGFVE